MEPELELDVNENKKYKVKIIKDSVVYANKTTEGQLSGLYYLLFWKNHLEDESIEELTSVIMHLWKIISTFHKNYLEKPIRTSSLIDSTPPMAKPSTKSLIKTLK